MTEKNIPPYPSPPPPYPSNAGYMAGSAVPQVVIHQPGPAVVQVASLGPHPTNFYCAFCKQQIVTKTHHTNGCLTWILCLLIFLFGGVFGCCLIPFCCDSCKNVEHQCPQCKRFLGVHNRV
ncbi:Lipopolysaccharide-induced tumor necrosis factor-alpha factor [Paragonimus heterotremus]|uniref:Lipopolysaccharide-induced tumor necrosis factor-alpha factor n=1 Tax=Paragonimus heterotremus TaxID=100268 RepID=A0A8J4SUN6_9TREM|nr:Lipopolysaccharide-induced tumor necrosis factor-alpha factor [Paragonimus heterotremus]